MYDPSTMFHTVFMKFTFWNIFWSVPQKCIHYWYILFIYLLCIYVYLCAYSSLITHMKQRKLRHKQADQNTENDLCLQNQLRCHMALTYRTPKHWAISCFLRTPGWRVHNQIVLTRYWAERWLSQMSSMQMVRSKVDVIIKCETLVLLGGNRQKLTSIYTGCSGCSCMSFNAAHHYESINLTSCWNTNTWDMV